MDDGARFEELRVRQAAAGVGLPRRGRTSYPRGMENETTEAPSEIKTVLQWAASLKPKRSLLCLAAALERWDPVQDPGSLDENEMTEKEFKEALARAQELYARVKTQAAQMVPARSALLLPHPKLLHAVIVRRPNLADLDAQQKMMVGNVDDDSDPGPSFEARKRIMRDQFQAKLLWPNEKDSMAQKGDLIEKLPVAFGQVYPGLIMELLGADAESVKKRG